MSIFTGFTDINVENPKIAVLQWSEDKMKLFFDFLSQFILNVRGNQDKTRLFKKKCKIVCNTKLFAC